ncbi:ATP-dependent DNA helicase RecG [Lysinibacillus sp. UGB7]|uniref:ATP-dependent DNA helicase RecG n=1 Tax=Lysinibacillus sp. UGB7 TaxID=3411039 RepID=UPI003B7B8DDD
MFIEALDIPKAKLKQLQNKGFETIEDLAGYFPKKYYDFRYPVPFNGLIAGETQATVGRLMKVKVGEKVVRFSLKNEFNQWLNVSFFRAGHMADRFDVGKEILVAGKVEADEYGLKMVSPLIFTHDIQENCRILPIYTKVPGMSNDYLEKCMVEALRIIPEKELLEPKIVQHFNLIPNHQAYQLLHNPMTLMDIENAKKRIEFNRMFEYGLKVQQQSKERMNQTNVHLKTFEYAAHIMNNLPFTLTQGQLETLRDLSLKMANGNQKVNALVQGDVGCGKTLIAILMLVTMVEAGYQSVLMAPTNVLAKQHFNELEERVADLGVNIAYLSGETKTRERKKILKGLADGEIQIVVGTHSVLSKDVEYQSLGLMVVDEQHRFGVKQRQMIQEKSSFIHQIDMSATPIPRSLTMALYGDSMDVYTITSMPNGRKKIITGAINDEMRAWNGIRTEVSKGHQAYVICPLIEESDDESMENVESVDQVYDKLVEEMAGFCKVGKITGKMKANEIAEILGAFSRNEIQILVSTTIVEVGVNVPNSTIIVIKNAERFGLAQLHQLRGRVGRSALQSYCVLLSEKWQGEKLQSMVLYSDGGEIAKKDVEIRGAGDWIGTKQSGGNPDLELVMQNVEKYREIQNFTREIVNDEIRFKRYSTLMLDESELIAQV